MNDDPCDEWDFEIIDGVIYAFELAFPLIEVNE
jgi:hypothetical protein